MNFAASQKMGDGLPYYTYVCDVANLKATTGSSEGD